MLLNGLFSTPVLQYNSIEEGGDGMDNGVNLLPVVVGGGGGVGGGINSKTAPSSPLPRAVVLGSCSGRVSTS